jgi:hypothetical protein
MSHMMAEKVHSHKYVLPCTAKRRETLTHTLENGIIFSQTAKKKKIAGRV